RFCRVLVLFCDLWGAAKTHRRWAGRRRIVRSQKRCGRDRILAVIEFCLRDGEHLGRRAQRAMVRDGDGRDLPSRPRISRARSAGIHRSRRPRLWTDAKRFPFGVFLAGRIAWLARVLRHPLVADDDGPGFHQGLSRRHYATPALLRAILACARHHLGRDLLGGLSDWERHMSEQGYELHGPHDLAPGEEEEVRVGPRLLGYVTGLGLAILLTATSFFVAGTD